MNASIPINTILIHTEPHLDEIEALRRLRTYGNNFFPGIEKATLRFTQGLDPRPDSSFDSAGILPVGCGHTRFDEHRDGIDRLPNECATTLVDKHLGLGTDLTLKKISEEVLRCDCKRGVKNTELAEVIKVGNRRLKNNGVNIGEFVVKWATVALQAIHNQLCFNFAAVTGEKSLLKLFEELKKSGRFPNEKACASLEKQVRVSMERKGQSITELAFVIECLYRTNTVPAGEIVDWVRFPLDHIYDDQVAFWEAVEECKSKGSWFQVRTLCRGSEQYFPLLVIRSDNPLVMRAGKLKEAGGAAVIVLRNGKSNVAVFIDCNIPGLNLVNFARMIRWLELPKDERGAPTVKIPWEDLGNEGEIKEVPQWYFFRQAQQLFNGSQTHPDVPATMIADKVLVDLARRAFHPRLVGDWMRERNIPLPEPKRSGTPLKNPVIPAEKTAADTGAETSLG